MKRLLLLALSMSPLMAIDPTTALVRTQNGFNLHIGDTSRAVKSYDVDSRLKTLNNEQLGRVAAMGCLRARELSNGDYRVEVGGGLKGGGGFGAWLGSTIGVAGVNIIGHSVLWGVASFAGPAAPGVYAGLAATYGPAIAAASKVAGVSLGLAAAVATGPV